MNLIVKKYELIIAVTVILLVLFGFWTSVNNTPLSPASEISVREFQSLLVSKNPVASDAATIVNLSVTEGQTLTRKKKVALTFDDGPHPYYTDALIKTLKDYSVPATFFVVGKQMEKYPEILRRITTAGFGVGGHSYTHSHLISSDEMSATRIVESELERTRFLIKKFTDVDSYIFRPPGGRYDEKLVETARKSGYRMVLWDVLPKDHIADLHPEEISSRVISGVISSEGGIVLMHSGNPATIKALDTIIPRLRRSGYTFVKLE